MGSNAVDRELFLACRAVFNGPYAAVRHPRKIRELLSQNSTICEDLVDRYGRTTVVKGLKRLLKTEIFSSSLKAKEMFPELFETNLDRDKQRAASEQEARRLETEALANSENEFHANRIREQETQDAEETRIAETREDGGHGESREDGLHEEARRGSETSQDEASAEELHEDEPHEQTIVIRGKHTCVALSDR